MRPILGGRTVRHEYGSRVRERHPRSSPAAPRTPYPPTRSKSTNQPAHHPRPCGPRTALRLYPCSTDPPLISTARPPFRPTTRRYSTPILVQSSTLSSASAQPSCGDRKSTRLNSSHV